MKKVTVGAILMVALVLTSCWSREKRNQKAEEAGQAVTEKQASFVKGIGQGLKGLGKEAVETVSEGVGEVLKGGNEGLDKSLVKIEVRVADKLKETLGATRAETNLNDSTQAKEVIVYTIFEKDFDGKLVLKAFDKGNQEIGRSVVALKEASDNSRFVEFPFDKRTSFTLIKYLLLDAKSE